METCPRLEEADSPAFTFHCHLSAFECRVSGNIIMLGAAPSGTGIMPISLPGDDHVTVYNIPKQWHRKSPRRKNADY